MARKCHLCEATKDEGLVTNEEISAFKNESNYERRSLRMENYPKQMLVILADAGMEVIVYSEVACALHSVERVTLEQRILSFDPRAAARMAIPVREVRLRVQRQSKF
jgi:hypothetical protein